MSLPTDLFPMRIAVASARPSANVMEKKHKVGFITVTQATRALRSREVNDYFGIFLFLLEHFDVVPLMAKSNCKRVRTASSPVSPARSSKVQLEPSRHSLLPTAATNIIPLRQKLLPQPAIPVILGGPF